VGTPSSLGLHCHPISILIHSSLAKAIFLGGIHHMSDISENRLARIEERLSQIENHLGIPRITTPPSPVASPELDAWAEDTSPIQEKTAPITEPENPINWLGLTALICFVLAAGFIIKLSIDSGWLTPARQMGISALLGCSLIGVGLKFMKLDREYASLLPSAGIIILYLTTFGAYRYYDLISIETAITLTSLVSLLCIGLYHKIKHDVYAITASVGTYISPLILGLHVSNDFSLYYFIVCSLSFAAISIYLKSRILILIPANLAILLTAFIGFDLHQDVLVASCLGLNFLIFSIGTYFYSKYHQKPLDENEAWAFLPALLVFYATEYFYLQNINEHLAPWASLGFSAVLIGLYVSARKFFSNGLGSQSLILSFTTLVFFHSVYIELLPDDFKHWLLIPIALGAAFIPTSTLSKKYQDYFLVPLLAIGVIFVIEYITIAKKLFDIGGMSWVMVSLATVASIWILLVKKSDMLRTKSDAYYGLLASAHILAILGLYRLANDVSSLAVSASWLIYAVIVMLFSTWRKDAVMAKSALIALGFAAGKALLYDAANAPTLIRIFCLLLTGVVLYGCGFLMRRVATWKITT
jgi:hypothetical protein